MNCVDKIARQYQESFFSTIINSKDFQELPEGQQKELKGYIERFKSEFLNIDRS